MVTLLQLRLPPPPVWVESRERGATVTERTDDQDHDHAASGTPNQPANFSAVAGAMVVVWWAKCQPECPVMRRGACTRPRCGDGTHTMCTEQERKEMP